MLIWLNFIIYCIYIDCKKKSGDSIYVRFGFCLTHGIGNLALLLSII